MKSAICDDEKRICAILAEKVGKICPGAEILTYASGEELLGADILPDILLLDIKMPGMSGMQEYVSQHQGVQSSLNRIRITQALAEMPGPFCLLSCKKLFTIHVFSLF